jgi:hypothetical protein
LSDDARRQFLGALVDALGAGWSASFDVVRRFDVLGATLQCKGVAGHVEVVPSNVTNNVVSWKPFPSGKPHYDIHTDGGEHLRTCVLAKAVAMLEGWRRSHARVERAAFVAMEIAIAAPAPVQIEDAIDAGLFRLTSAGEAALVATRAAIDPAAIDRGFPRDDDGRITLETQALLAKLASSAKLARGRDVFLVARAPHARKAGNVVTLAIADAIRDNASHDWTEAPWLWRRGAKPPAIDPRAAVCCELLDAGRFDDAFAMFEIVLAPATIKVLEGVAVNTHDAELAGVWRDALRRMLWDTAPWALAKRPPGRLGLLPNQRHQRKAWLAWAGKALDIEYTASNARLPHVAWKRRGGP